MKKITKYTHSPFITNEARTVLRGKTEDEIYDLLLAVGVPPLDAEEFAEDRNSVPTNVRKAIVTYLKEQA